MASSLRKNFAYQIVYQLLALVLPFITSPILSRSLGASGLGIYAYVTTIGTYFSLVGGLGVAKYGTREIAKAKDDKKRVSAVFKEIWILHLLISTPVGLLYLFYIFLFSEYRLYFLICFIGYLGSVININWLYFGLEDFKLISLRDCIVKITCLILIVIFVHDSDDLLMYFVIMQFSALFSNLLFWINFRKRIVKTHVCLKRVFKHFFGLLVLFIPVLIEGLYAGIGRVLIGTLSTKEQVGFYDNADKALIARSIIYALTIVMMPKMSNVLAKSDFKQFDSLMIRTTHVILFLSIAFGFGTAAIARPFSVLFWGNDFAACATPIVIMAFGIPAMSLSREIREQFLIPIGKNREYMFAVAAGTLVNVIVNLLLIPSFGAAGAACASLLAEIVVLCSELFLVRKELDLRKYFSGGWFYVIPGFAMFAIVFSMSNFLNISWVNLLLCVCGGALIYANICVMYWKRTNDVFFLSIVKKFFHL